MRRLKGAVGTLGGIALVVLWLAVSFVVIDACSSLTAQSCDPQNSYNHCETPSGSGPGNK